MQGDGVCWCHLLLSTHSKEGWPPLAQRPSLGVQHALAVNNHLFPYTRAKGTEGLARETGWTGWDMMEGQSWEQCVTEGDWRKAGRAQEDPNKGVEKHQIIRLIALAFHEYAETKRPGES